MLRQGLISKKLPAEPHMLGKPILHNGPNSLLLHISIHRLGRRLQIEIIHYGIIHRLQQFHRLVAHFYDIVDYSELPYSFVICKQKGELGDEVGFIDLGLYVELEDVVSQRGAGVEFYVVVGVFHGGVASEYGDHFYAGAVADF